MTYVLVAVLYFVGFATAQFNFFGNMFQGQQQQHQQQRSAASQWAAYSDGVSCSQYVCPATLDCVARPVDCPCPNPEDIKCIIPDVGISGKLDGEGTVVCTRGGNDCSEVEKLMHVGAQHKKK